MVGLIVAAGAAALAGGAMLAAAFRTQLDVEEVSLPLLPAGFDGSRLFVISDIHRRVIPEQLIEQAEAAGGADLVLIIGDVTERGVPLARTRANIRRLAALAPVYAVYGNNDEPLLRELDVLLREEGAHVLHNAHVMLEQRDGSQVMLCGVGDPVHRRDRLEVALQNEEGMTITPQPFTVLLAHDPMLAERLGGCRVDLMLCGHTHGGQICLPGIGPLVRAAELRKYLGGWYRIPREQPNIPGMTRMLVSRGFGTSKLPLRAWAPAQAHLLILRSQDKDHTATQ